MGTFLVIVGAAIATLVGIAVAMRLILSGWIDDK
jgi:hypothetical protein